MKYISLSLFLICCIFSGFAQTKTSLFNGHNFEGWNIYEPKTGLEKKTSTLFRVENEMIRLFGKNPAYLITEKSYENFELCLEYRWNTDSTFLRKSQIKNSGVMYLIPENTEHKLWPKGLQFQIKEGSTGDLIMLDGFLLETNNSKPAGENKVSPRFEDVTFPIGEWNAVKISSQNGKIIQYLNGKLVNNGHSPCITKGKILLQYEGYPIDFRNITLTEF